MTNKFYFLFLVVLLANAAAHGQVTITQADFPMVDQAGIMGGDTSTAIGTGSAGASQTWNFASFVPSRLDTSYLTASTFAGNPLFPSATFSSCATAAGFSMCSFGYSSATGLYLVGAEQTISFGPTTLHNIVTMTPQNQVIKFPFTYTNSHSFSYVQHQVSTYTPALAYDSTKAIYYRTVDQQCDGWGTLTTPYGTYNAIRMKQIQSNIDTSYTHTAGTWTVSSTSALSRDTSYTWFAPGIGTVAIISGRAPYRYSFYKAGFNSGIAATTNSSAAVYPNPATETLYITNVATGTKLALVDATGRMIYNTTLASSDCSIDLRPYQRGLYLLQLTDAAGNRTTQKIVKQ